MRQRSPKRSVWLYPLGENLFERSELILLESNERKWKLTPQQTTNTMKPTKQRTLNMLKPSTILSESGVLRLKSQTNGVPKLQGVFRMRDQEGFPVDMSYEIAKENGWEIDWVEALADAGRQCIFKYDALIEEIGMLEPDKLDGVKRMFALGFMSSEGETFTEQSSSLYNRMRESHLTAA